MAGDTRVNDARSMSESKRKDIVASRLLRSENFLIDDRYGRGSFLETLIEKIGWSPSYAIGAIKEYKRFMILQSLDSTKQLRPSFIVDSVWHLHLLYTSNYQHFCRSVLDIDFIHHDPSKGGYLEENKENQMYYETLTAYAKAFSVPAPKNYWGFS
jgi:hypothetical protein